MIVNTSSWCTKSAARAARQLHQCGYTRLKRPVASIRLHLETLQRRELAETATSGFYRIMLHDTSAMLGTVEQVASRGPSRRQKRDVKKRRSISGTGARLHGTARTRHHLQPDALRF